MSRGAPSLDIDKELMVRASQSIAAMYSVGSLRPLIGQQFDFEGITDPLPLR